MLLLMLHNAHKTLENALRFKRASIFNDIHRKARQTVHEGCAS